MACALAHSWNQINPSLLKTYEKLKNLGFTNSYGKVVITDLNKEEDSNV